MLRPEFGIWSTLIALLSWGLKRIFGRLPFKRTSFDWPIAIFLLTAWVGYWSAYDKTTAWIKVWLIVTAILLYYALSTQPVENLGWLSILLFCVGVGVSVYFFLTHDFTDNFGKIGLWWVNTRPQPGWPAIHHGYISGVLAITTIFILYWFWEIQNFRGGRIPVSLSLFLILGLGIVVSAFVLTLSRGIWLAIGGAVGALISWKILNLNRFAAIPRMRSFFPLLVLVYLCAMIVFVYIGPAVLGENSTQADFGKNTRSELFSRGLYLLGDFPIFGSGLNSFPGLYSQYILVIPSYYFVNSYNLFLDAAIEQGLIGGLILISLYFGSVWFISQTIVTTLSSRIRVFSWLCLFALIITIVHGMLYDYLYNQNGTILLLFPIGISMIGILNSSRETPGRSFNPLLMLRRDNTQVSAWMSVVGGALIIILVLSFSRIESIWFANLGAVQMSQVELADFPTNRWADSSILPELEQANASFYSALQADPTNRTANHRLGIIAMLRGDFSSAVIYLEKAHQEAPNHRGIIKSLGYCYVWLGNMEEASVLLDKIPEARDELGVYVWWWGVQGRPDLAEKASIIFSSLESSPPHD